MSSGSGRAASRPTSLINESRRSLLESSMRSWEELGADESADICAVQAAFQPADGSPVLRPAPASTPPPAAAGGYSPIATPRSTVAAVLPDRRYNVDDLLQVRRGGE